MDQGIALRRLAADAGCPGFDHQVQKLVDQRPPRGRGQYGREFRQATAPPKGRQGVFQLEFAARGIAKPPIEGFRRGGALGNVELRQERCRVRELFQSPDKGRLPAGKERSRAKRPLSQAEVTLPRLPAGRLAAILIRLADGRRRRFMPNCGGGRLAGTIVAPPRTRNSNTHEGT